jgi:hypothetical protein
VSCQGEYCPHDVKVGVHHNLTINLSGVGGGLVDADNDDLPFLPGVGSLGLVLFLARALSTLL